MWVRLNHHFDLNYSLIKFHDYILHIFIGFFVCVPISTHTCFTVVGIFAYTSPSKLCYYQLHHRLVSFTPCELVCLFVCMIVAKCAARHTYFNHKSSFEDFSRCLCVCLSVSVHEAVATLYKMLMR